MALIRKFRKPAPGTVLGLIALVVALGGVAYASIPGPNGVIKGCYAKPGLLGIRAGELRVIDSNAHCRITENPISWNQQGAPGTNGTNGTNGVSGWTIVQGSGTGIAKAVCPPGKHALGGGGFVTLGAFERSFPLDDPNDPGAERGWLLDATNDSAGVGAFAICANVGP
jgi:hypothetical protein